MEFAEHRHRGHDIVLITQDPRDIDAYIRRKVGRHIHLTRARTGGERCTVRTLTNDVMDIERRAFKGADRFEYLFNKSVYPWYHSSDIHTHKRSLPRKLIYAIALLGLVFTGFAWISYTAFSEPVPQASKPPQATAQAPAQTTSAPVEPPAGQPSTQPDNDRLSVNEWLEQYAPRIEPGPILSPLVSCRHKPRTSAFVSVSKAPVWMSPWSSVARLR